MSLRVALIEDERPGLEQLRNYLLECDSSIQVVAEITSLSQGRKHLNALASADLIFSDIQLGDGLSFELLGNLPSTIPVVFITAFDSYLLQSFQHHSIDYLLKPLRKEKLNEALQKYQRLKGHFTSDLHALLQNLSLTRNQRRFLVKKGTSVYPMEEDQVAYFFTEHKLVFLVDHAGKKYTLEQALADLENQVAPNSFFRLNRKYLVSAKAIQQFRSDGKGRLMVVLKPDVSETIMVSQEKAGAFKRWLEGEG